MYICPGMYSIPRQNPVLQLVCACFDFEHLFQIFCLFAAFILEGIFNLFLTLQYLDCGWDEMKVSLTKEHLK